MISSSLVFFSLVDLLALVSMVPFALVLLNFTKKLDLLMSIIGMYSMEPSSAFWIFTSTKAAFGVVNKELDCSCKLVGKN